MLARLGRVSRCEYSFSFFRFVVLLQVCVFEVQQALNKLQVYWQGNLGLQHHMLGFV